MNKGKSNGFDFIRDATRIVEQNEVMKSFFKDRIAELDAIKKRVFQIIAKHQPISECDLRNHTRIIAKVDRRVSIIVLEAHGLIIRTDGDKLSVHPAFMEVL